MKKLVVDKETCLGCGTCAALCPKVFKIGEDGKAEVRQLADDQTADSSENIQNAIDSCPTNSIKWEEDAINSAKAE